MTPTNPKNLTREQWEIAMRLRDDLTDREREEALRIGRIQFASAGATRPKNMCNRHGVVNCKRCG